MATSTVLTNKPINPRGDDNRPVDSYNRAALYSGKALDFDGVNDKVDLPTLSFDLYAFSFYYEGAINSGTGQFVFHTGDGTNDGISIGSVTSLVAGETLMIGDNGNYTAVTESFDDAIHFIVCTWNATESKYNFYLNAQKLSTINSGTDAPLISLSTAPAIGYRKAIGDMYLNGKISNVRAFSTALTAAQVSDLYNNPEKIIPTGVSNNALKLWLPMMEGAGTTAYDGSGNGNHGTISGATWTHGIGAPVAQTAVMDWNKGTNKLPNSLVLTSANYNFNETSFEGGYLAPDGTNTAYKITKESGTSQYAIKSVISEGDDYRAIYARTTSGTGSVNLLAYGANTNNLFTITEEWQKFSVDSVTTTAAQGNFYLVDFRFSSTLTEVVLWAPHLAESESVYVPTNGTAQTSPVLLPQGLTSGRDITGVNLFENVRKQGALNLDGKSWAEVHDNASLDFGTGSFTLEAWIKGKFVSQGSVFNMVISLGGNITSSNNAGLMVLNNTVPYFIYSNPGALTGSAQTEGDWIHMVGTYDQTNTRFYVNGVQTGQSARTAADITNEFVKVIGRDGTDPNRYYNDQIAQPRIYNRALTASEVLNNYNATKDLYI